MTSKRCKKCHAERPSEKQACSECGDQPSKLKQVMTWFCIILLFVAGLFWAFTDSEPDVTLESTDEVAQMN